MSIVVVDVVLWVSVVVEDPLWPLGFVGGGLIVVGGFFLLLLLFLLLVATGLL